MDWMQPPEKPTRKASSSQWIGMVVGGLAGAGIGFLGVDLIGKWSASMEPGWRWLIVLYLPIAWLIAVGFHELGHLIGGWLIGGRFLLWVVGPIKVQRTPKGIQWGWNRSVNIGGGMGACLPHDCSRLTARQLIVMILGGPVASLVLWAGIQGVLLCVESASGPLASTLIAVATVTAYLSLLLAVLTLLPFMAGGFKSDGRRAWDLARGGPQTDQELAMMVLTMQLLAGTRPRELDPVLLGRSLSLNDGSLFDLYARMNAYHHAADRQDWAAARGYLETLAAAEAKMVPLLGATVRCEYAWLVATVGSDPTLARAWLDSAGPMDFDPATRLRSESAVLLAEGSREAAHAKALEGLKALDTRTMSPVRSPFAVESLEYLRDLSGARV
jgi:hypothetical protein